MINSPNSNNHYPVNQNVMQELQNDFDKEYSVKFGEISDKQPKDLEVAERILNSMNKQVQQIVITPKGFFDKCKWLLGLESSVDKKLKDKFDEVQLLNKTQPKSINQLKEMNSCQREISNQITEYSIRNTLLKKKEFEKNFLRKIFLKCLSPLFKIFYKSSEINKLYSNINRKSSPTLTLGQFRENGKEYDIKCMYLKQRNRNKNSAAIRVVIEDRESKKTINYFDIMKKENNPNQFTVEIEYCGDKYNYDCPIEIKREYLNSPNGSNRELDQKLTQVMIEVLLQNDNVNGIITNAHRDDSAILGTAGFHVGLEHPKVYDGSPLANGWVAARKFRVTEPANCLFPPYQDYSSCYARFNRDDFDLKYVLFSRDTRESWSEIIEKNTLLNAGAAVITQ